MDFGENIFSYPGMDIPGQFSWDMFRIVKQNSGEQEIGYRASLR